jgi:polyketide cyclase/dehydrase/lipid transport protein
MWNLTGDEVSRVIEAPARAIYEIIADVTRTPELSPEVVSCEWLAGGGPTVGARFRARNRARRGPSWSNTPEVITADPGREFAFVRRERMFGELVWRYRLESGDSGTTVRESYEVTKAVPLVSRVAMRLFYGAKDRPADLHTGMERTLARLAAVTEGRPASSRQATP